MWQYYLLAMVAGALLGAAMMAIIWASADGCKTFEACNHDWERVDYVTTETWPGGAIRESWSNVQCRDCGRREWHAEPDKLVRCQTETTPPGGGDAEK